MTITVANQHPVALDPVHATDPSGAYDPLSAVSATLTQPLLASAQQGRAVIVEEDGTDITAGLDDLVQACLTEGMDPAAEKKAKSLFGQTVTGIDTNSALPIAELFAMQAGAKHALPEPVNSGSRTVVYSPGEDIVPAAKELLAATADPDLFFVSLAYNYHPDTLGIWFRNSDEFEATKTWIADEVQKLRPQLSSKTLGLFDDFATIDLDGLTAAIQLRRADGDNDEPYSFARVLVHLLMSRAQAQQSNSIPTLGLLPFSLAEVFSPRSLVFVSAQAHADARAMDIDREWLMIKNGIANPVTVLSNRKIARLDAVTRASARARAAAHKARPGTPGSRAAKVAFTKTRPPRARLAKDVTRALRRMGKVIASHNVTKVTKSSHQRASRREPDNPDRPGKSTRRIYHPDIHVYIDTSGSMSPQHYRAAVMMLIVMAKKLNVDIYISSFSHVLSEETLLRVKGRTIAQVWKSFEAIPKVTGMTDFEQIWRYINANKKRRARFNLVITDFMWDPPTVRTDHPKNLYYAPVEAFDWGDVTEYAGEFVSNMHHIEPAIGRRMLGLIA